MNEQFDTTKGRDSGKNGYIVVLLGFDGSGRSSVLQKLHEDGYRVSTWRNLQDISELEFMRLSSKSPGKWRENLPPLTRGAYLILALIAEYEGYQPFYIASPENGLGIPTRDLAEIFYPNVTTWKRDIQGSQTLLNCEKAKSILGFESGEYF